MKTIDQIVPRLLANTKRRGQKRAFNLVDVANDISFLSDQLGGLSKVADMIGISTGMLNKFLAVNKLSDKTKKLIEERQIDSVELVNKLSRFTLNEQEWIAEQVICGNINSIDIRLLSPLRSQYPKLSLTELLTKLNDSENKRVSVIEFSADDMHRDLDEVKNKLAVVVGIQELLSFVIDGDQGIIRITSKGEKELRKAAKLSRTSLQEFTYTLLQ